MVANVAALVVTTNLKTAFYEFVQVLRDTQLA
jgi:hypothetical protein